uniref:Uncharacterized protein n=2 Tax=Cyprinus carpio TaxID=7962 RepID=A0A8C1IWP5_CYPCA
MSSSKDTLRSQRRRELDARRSKSRVRLGSCLQSWGQLKEKLGFSLHSELAQHLLERPVDTMNDYYKDNYNDIYISVYTNRQ